MSTFNGNPSFPIISTTSTSTYRQKPAPCYGCMLHPHGTDFSQVEGLGTLGVMIVAEASGEHEQRDQLPLRPYAPSGGILERCLRRMGYDRSQFTLTNVGRCRPRDNFLDGAPWEQAAIAHCKPNLLAAIAQAKPKVILALGNIAFRTLTGISGTKQTVTHMRGYAFRALPEFCQAAGIRDLVVVPTLHPAFLRRGAIHLSGLLMRDIQRAVNIRLGKDKSFILDMPLAGMSSAEIEANPGLAEQQVQEWLRQYNLRYQLKPDMIALDLFCRDVKARSDAWLAQTPDMQAASLLALSWDLETYESASLDEDESDGYSDTQIRLFQASVEPGAGVALPWTGDYIKAARWLLKLPLPKVGHNQIFFDYRVVRAVGRRDFGDATYLLPNGPLHDTMLMFHYWQPDIPAHLQAAASFVQFPFPWKHLAGDNLEFYGVADTDSALRVYMVVRRTMEDRGIWYDYVAGRQAAGFVAMVEQVRPILADMEDRGFPVDNEKRLELDAVFEKEQLESLAELDARFPNQCRKLTPKEKGVVKGYVGVPAQVKELLERISPTMLPKFTEQGVVTPAKSRRKKDGTIEEIAESVKTVVLDSAGNKVTKKFRDEQIKQAMQARWTGITPDEMQQITSTRFYEKPDEYELGITLEQRVNDAGHVVWVTRGEDGEMEEVPSASYRYEIRRVQQQLVNDLWTEGKLAWVRVYEFSPNSSAQLQAYMQFKHHKIPTKKTGENTTGKDELVKLSKRTGDNFYMKVIENRELGKARGTFIEGFKPGADGRVHTTFTFATATGQLSSRNPVNFQNVAKHGRLAKPIRSMFRHPNGKLIVEWDFKAYHVLTTGFCAKSAEYMRLAKLDMHSFVAGHFNKDWDAFKLFDATDEDLVDHFKWFKKDKDRKFLRDKKAKPCIAEGELVLTDQGLVPIQEITLAHKVWDGVEWVSHGGVIYQGEKEVITYDGLTATKCHQVVTRDGNIISFGEGASRLVRLESTGSAGTPIRTRHRDKLEASAKGRLLARAREVCDMRERKDNRSAQFDTWWNIRLPVVHTDQVTTSRSSRSEIRRDRGSLLLSAQSKIPGLRRTWNNLQVRVSQRLCSICDQGASSQRLQGSGNRPYRQPWSLRAWKSTPSNTQRAVGESPQHEMGPDKRRESPFGELCQSLQYELDWQANAPRNDRRADYPERDRSLYHGNLQKMEGGSSVVKKARVYDIVDAGPRRCYTVSNKLVLNCILGIGFGLGVNKLYDMNSESFQSRSEAQAFMDLIRSLFPAVFRWQEQIRRQAHEQGYLINRFGMIRWFYEVYAPDGRGGWKPGEQSEQAIAFLPASEAFGNIREAMKELERRDLFNKWEGVNTVHDSIVFLVEPDRLEEHQHDVYPVLHAPSKVLIDPTLAPGGLVVDAECSAGVDWASLEEVKLPAGLEG